MIKCVIFDLDGLMVNTEVIARKVYQDEALKFGYDLDEDFFIGITGSTIQASKQHIERYVGLNKHIPYILTKRKEAIINQSKIIGSLNKPGLIELLDYLFKNNYKVCVATSSNLDYATSLINSFGKAYCFDAVCTGDMVTHHKPDPEVFLLAAKSVGVKPEECLVLEDSKNGIIAAKRANMLAGFIYDTVKEDDIVKNLYDYKFNTLDEVIEILK